MSNGNADAFIPNLIELPNGNSIDSRAVMQITFKKKDFGFQTIHPPRVVVFLSVGEEQVIEFDETSQAQDYAKLLTSKVNEVRDNWRKALNETFGNVFSDKGE